MNVLLFYIVYPLAMGTYFRRALERRTDIDLRVAGPYSGAFIPWLGGMNLPPKYAKPPHVALPWPSQQVVDYDRIRRELGGWKPDLIINVDAGVHFQSKPDDGILATVATDPHVLDYTAQRIMSDKFFNMQKVYSQEGDIYLPYAYDPTVWYPVLDTEKVYDAALIGMPYAQRVEWIQALQNKGVRVAFENGPVFDEARDIYNKANIGLNWSSLLDLNARVFELMAMGLCPVINRVPDLPLFFEEDKHYLGFDNLQEAVEKVLWAKNNQGAVRIAENARDAVKQHTYDARIGQIFEECGF